MKLTKIYTRTGDAGKTSLVGGERTQKDCARIEAYGTMDELSSDIGMLIALLPENANEIIEDLERIQCNIFNICTFLATDTSTTPLYPSARLSKSEIDFLETKIDETNALLPTLDSFLLPGGSQSGAWCHVVRTVCRRAERRIITLYAEAYPTLSEAQDEANAQAAIMLKYVNRLSDYLFVLSRRINNLCGREEKKWQNTCK